MRKWNFFAAALVLTGCQSSVLQGYVGKPIEEPVLDMGPPMNVVDLGGGQRAYQWDRTSAGAIPTYAPTTSGAVVAGYTPYYAECVDTLLAAKNGNRWVVTGYRMPKPDCE